MKRIVALLLSVVMLSCVMLFPANAIVVNHTVTWIMIPEHLGLNRNYVADNYAEGEQVRFPSIDDPVYETDTYYYVFAGWRRFQSVAEIIDYYENKPGIGMNAPFTQEPLPVMGKKDLNYGAVFRLIPKAYDLTGDRWINIQDVTCLLDFLATATDYDPAYDVMQEGEVSIKGVTTLLNFLAD